MQSKSRSCNHPPGQEVSLLLGGETGGGTAASAPPLVLIVHLLLHLGQHLLHPPQLQRRRKECYKTLDCRSKKLNFTRVCMFFMFLTLFHSNKQTEEKLKAAEQQPRDKISKIVAKKIKIAKQETKAITEAKNAKVQ